MKTKFVLYVKTFSKDFNLVKRLKESIEKHNKDNIPFYISCPSSQKQALYNTIGDNNFNFIADEEIFQLQHPNLLTGWRQQQIVKVHLWKALDIDAYLCLDSDHVFIKDFYLKDFIHPSGTPYTLIHENKELWRNNKIYLNKTYNNSCYSNSVKAYRNIFSSYDYDKIWDYGQAPYIWSSKVWDSLYKEYLTPNNFTFETFQIHMEREYNITMREAVVYGEYLLATKLIDIYPISSLFKVYNNKSLHEFEDKHGLSDINLIKQNYLGVNFQRKIFKV